MSYYLYVLLLISALAPPKNLVRDYDQEIADCEQCIITATTERARLQTEIDEIISQTTEITSKKRELEIKISENLDRKGKINYLNGQKNKATNKNLILRLDEQITALCSQYTDPALCRVILANFDLYLRKNTDIKHAEQKRCQNSDEITRLSAKIKHFDKQLKYIKKEQEKAIKEQEAEANAEAANAEAAKAQAKQIKKQITKEEVQSLLNIAKTQLAEADIQVRLAVTNAEAEKSKYEKAVATEYALKELPDSLTILDKNPKKSGTKITYAEVTSMIDEMRTLLDGLVTKVNPHPIITYTPEITLTANDMAESLLRAQTFTETFNAYNNLLQRFRLVHQPNERTKAFCQKLLLYVTDKIKALNPVYSEIERMAHKIQSNIITSEDISKPEIYKIIGFCMCYVRGLPIYPISEVCANYLFDAAENQRQHLTAEQSEFCNQLKQNACDDTAEYMQKQEEIDIFLKRHHSESKQST